MIGLLFGRSVVWNGQARDAHGVAWATAVRGPVAAVRCSASRSAARSRRSRRRCSLWSLPLTARLSRRRSPSRSSTASPHVGDALARHAALRDPRGVRAAGRDPRPRGGLTMALAKGTAAAIARLAARLSRRHGAQRARWTRSTRASCKPGDLAFDIGAHVGDRISSFRRLGARVVALEPQPGPARVIRLIHGRDPQVVLVEAAAGDARGRRSTLHVNSANPTVSTASAAFIARGRRRRRLGGAGLGRDDHRALPDPRRPDPRRTAAGLRQDRRRGLRGPGAGRAEPAACRRCPSSSPPSPARSRERCLDRLAALGPYRFDVALGETQRLIFGRWHRRVEMAAVSRETCRTRPIRAMSMPS